MTSRTAAPQPPAPTAAPAEVPAAAPTPGHAYYAGTGPRLLGLGLRVLQRLAPPLAVRAAARLFGTPLPRAPRRPAAWPAGWSAALWPFEQGGLALHRAPPPAGGSPRGHALLVHGWGGHAGQLLPLAEQLAAHGWQAHLLELPAHGAAAGRTSNLPQFARAIDCAAARLAAAGEAPQLLAAHSLGANAAAYAVARGLPLGPGGRLVLLAPPASPAGYLRLFAQAFGLREPLRSRLQPHIEAREGVLLAQFEPPAVGPRIAVPTLVVHDRGDRVNAFADGEAFAAAIPGAALAATDGLGHRKLLADAAVLQRVAGFAAGRP